MTAAALSWGCAFLAFGPTATLLFLLAYQKAQLVIVATVSAFAYLISALGASLLWYLIDLTGWNHVLPILLPGLIFSFLGRCAFVAIYHKVERVIEVSIARHEQHTDEFQETAKLRLELNDWACGLAAGTGFGFMHAVLLYGTLLASESGNVGTLYQPSCPQMPSLVLSALNTFFFSILDVVWMLLTFYGMRQRSLKLAPDGAPRRWGALLERSRKGGHQALGIVLFTHTYAAFSTAANNAEGGCTLSLSLIGSITVVTVLLFWGGVSRIYLPANQQRRVGMGSDEGAFHTD